jgi:endonuclease III
MPKSGPDHVIEAIFEHWNAQPKSDLSDVPFASDDKANELVKRDVFAFLLASCIDRTGDSTLLWNIPQQLKDSWGHLDSAAIKRMDPAELAANPVIARAPGQVSRVQLARTIIDLAEMVQEEYDGQPERMLEGSISDIMDNLQQVFGVGPNIARMVIILRILYFGLKPARTGRLLPKIDVHVQRVFTRTGIVDACTERAVRILLKDYPIEDIAAIDQVCWGVGREYCEPKDPKCDKCPVASACKKVGVAARAGGANNE